jgi:hypothetical protein
MKDTARNLIDGGNNDDRGFGLYFYYCVCFWIPVAYINQLKALIHVGKDDYRKVITSNICLNRKDGCLSFVSVGRCQVEVSASG